MRRHGASAPIADEAAAGSVGSPSAAGSAAPLALSSPSALAALSAAERRKVEMRPAVAAELDRLLELYPELLTMATPATPETRADVGAASLPPLNELPPLDGTRGASTTDRSAGVDVAAAASGGTGSSSTPLLGGGGGVFMCTRGG